MDVMYERCAGLDVHKASVTACVRTPGARRGERRGETRTFGTTMRALENLAHLGYAVPEQQAHDS